MNAELSKLQEKARKARWYQRRKAFKSSASIRTSDDSDFSMLSPGTSQTATQEVRSNTDRESEPDSDLQEPGDDSVFSSGLPVDSQ